WNFGVQRQLPFHTVLEASYVGNINRHLLELVNINMPTWGSMWDAANVDPTYTGANATDGTHTLPANFYRPMKGLDRWNLPEWGGTANYTPLQVTANRRMSKNLMFSVAYTFSKALGSADSIYYASAIPGQVRSSNYGRLSYDRTNSLVLHYTYNLPHP